MQKLNVTAKMEPGTGDMLVTLEAGGQTFHERMDRLAWNAYLAALDSGPLRIGGMTLNMSGPAAEEAAAGIRAYLRQVDEALRVTGRTDFLRPA